LIKVLKKIIKKLLRIFNWRLEKLISNENYNTESPSEAVINAIKNSTGVFHLGAHRGEEAPIYEWFGKKVIWVEANPIIFEDLKDNLIKYKYQKAYQALLYSKDNEEIDFYLSNNDYASSSIFEFGELSVGIKSLWFNKNLKHILKKKLTTTTIDTLVRRYSINIKNYNYWVIDLQGAELLALNGAHETLNLCKYIYIEVSDGQVYKNGAQWRDVKKFLEKKNFRAASDLDYNHSNILFTRS
jgi:FkbM family methyltransferase